MDNVKNDAKLDYRDRIEILRDRKMDQTREKWEIIGSMDYDDWALILPRITSYNVCYTKLLRDSKLCRGGIKR